MIGPMPGGGSKKGGAGLGESMDENSMMQALAGAGGNAGVGKSGAGPSLGGKPGSGSNPGGSNAPGGGANIPGSMPGGVPKPQVEPREVGTIGEEAKRGLGDAWTEVKKFFSINTWLGIDPENMDPEEQAKAKEFHGRYNQLDQEQQAVAKQMHQEKMQKKKMQEEEDKQKKEVEAQKKAQSAQVPSSPQKGAKGQGGKSKKGQAMQKLQQDRTTIGTTQGE